MILWHLSWNNVNFILNWLLYLVSKMQKVSFLCTSSLEINSDGEGEKVSKAKIVIKENKILLRMYLNLYCQKSGGGSEIQTKNPLLGEYIWINWTNTLWCDLILGWSTALWRSASWRRGSKQNGIRKSCCRFPCRPWAKISKACS